MKQIRLYLLLLTLAISACKKDRDTESIDPNQLPPVTETGANILACKVNGKTQVYSGVPITLDEKGVSFTKYNSPDRKAQHIEIVGSNNKYGDEITISILCPNWEIEVNKEYQFSLENKIGGKYYLTNANTLYRTNGNNSGYVRFTKYGEIVSGRFAFTAYSNSDSITITEGFFDITPNSN